MGGKFPRDLTPAGEEQVRATAQKIIDAIDPENEIVVLWSSPAWRAQGSEEIIRELLDKKGISVYKDSSIRSMKSFDQYDKEFINDLIKKSAETKQSIDVLYSRDPLLQEKSERFENQSEVRKRAEKVFNWIRYLAEHAQLNDKKLHIIGASHFEFINPIMEDIFGYKVEDGLGVQKGENMTIKFDFDSKSKDVTISADFSGEHKDGISFDTKRRKFFIKE